MFINMFCVSWRADFEFRGPRRARRLADGFWKSRTAMGTACLFLCVFHCFSLTPHCLSLTRYWARRTIRVKLLPSNCAVRDAGPGCCWLLR